MARGDGWKIPRFDDEGFLSCIAEDCSKPRYSRAMCTTHYSRFRRESGLDVKRAIDPERFWANVDKHAGLPLSPNYAWNADMGECWIWGNGNPDKYGTLRVMGNDGRSVTLSAHRFSYELAYGPSDRSLDLDHACRRKRCVNPAHLEPVTRSENTLRSVDFNPRWKHEETKGARSTAVAA